MYSFSCKLAKLTAEALSPCARAERTQSETLGSGRGEVDRAWGHRVGGARRRHLSLDYQSWDQGIGINPEANGCSSYSPARWGAQENGGARSDTKEV